MIHNETYTVTTYQVDINGRVTVPVVCGMMQETASRYCYENEISLEHLNQKNLTWMIIKQYVEFESFPGWLDRINVSTWPRTLKGLRALRDYSVTDEKGKIIAKSTTNWVLLNTETRRPVKIDDVAQNLTTVDKSVFGNEIRINVNLPECEYQEKHFNVRYSDLDINGHVNNIKYIEWCLDSVPADFQKSHTVKNLTIEFMQETYADDEVKVKTAFSEDTSFFELINLTRGQTICKVSMDWKECIDSFS